MPRHTVTCNLKLTAIFQLHECQLHHLDPSMDLPAFRPAPYDSWVVGVVRVVVHNLGPVKPGAHISCNHWTVSLLVAPTTQDVTAQRFSASVRLDLRPEGPKNGTLHIDFLGYLLTQNAAKHFDFAASHSGRSNYCKGGERSPIHEEEASIYYD